VVRGAHVLCCTVLYCTYLEDLLVPNSYVFSPFMVSVIDRSARKLWKRHLLEERQGISAEIKWISRAMRGWMDPPLPFLFSPSIEILVTGHENLCVCVLFCNLLQCKHRNPSPYLVTVPRLRSDKRDSQPLTHSTGLQVNYEYSVISSTRTSCGFSSMITQN
jgi:hypothetical protein